MRSTGSQGCKVSVCPGARPGDITPLAAVAIIHLKL
jgi:hypothetical protein